MSILRHIPNALTCCNLLCGCLAILAALQGQLYLAGYLVGAALVFDFFDGFLARQMGVTSAIGKDLDSLADMVTFGLVPAMIMYTLINIAGWLESGMSVIWSDPMPPFYALSFVALLIPVFSALRLAKFNNDVRQGDTFRGLPTPANAMVICSLPFIAGFDRQGGTADPSWMLNTWFLCGLCVFMSYLLVSDLPLFALKFADFTWANNKIRFIFLAVSAVVLILLKFGGVPVVIMLYVAVSLVNNIFSGKTV